MDVFHHDDRVVDQNADRKNQREQRHAVQRKPIRPRSKQGRGECQQHRTANDQGFALAQRKQHQQHHRRGREQQFLDQLFGLVIRSGTVIAADGRDHALGDHAAFQRRDAGDHLVGNIDRIFARLLGDRQGHRRVGLAAGLFVRPADTRAKPHVLSRLIGTGDHAGDVADENRLAVRHADNQLPDIRCARQKRTGFYQQFAVVGGQRAGRLRGIGQLQHIANVLRANAKRGHTLRIHHHAHHIRRAADGRDFARARDALQFDFCGVRDLCEFKAAARGVGSPQRDGNDRHVVDAQRFDDGFAHAQLGRNPVPVRLDGVVQTHQRLGAVLPDLELHRQHRHAGFGHRIDMLDAGDLRQHLFGRRGDQRLDILDRRADKRNEHVGHGHVDLRLFFARRHGDREQAHQRGHQRDQRRQLRVQKKTRNPPGSSHRGLH